MKLNELKNDLTMQLFFDEFSNKPTTKAHFYQSMQKYTEFTKMTPDELLSEAEEEIKNGILMRSRKIRRYLIAFKEYLNRSDLAPKTKKGILSDVKSFYKHHDIDLPNFKIDNAKPLPENKYIPKKEEIKESLKYCTIRNRAIVLSQCSSGMGSAEILNLRVGHFKDGYDENTGVTTLKITRVKTNYDYVTFLSPEASQAVWDYIEDRNKKPAYTGTVRVRTQNKHKIYSENDFLFIKDDVPASFLKSMDDNERKLNQQGLMDVYRTIAERMGISTDVGKWQKFRSHNMRKYFNDTLRNEGADINFVDFLMGHVSSETHTAYHEPNIDKLKEKYIKYLPFLTIGETEIHTIESNEYLELKKNYIELSKRLSLLEGISKEEDRILTFYEDLDEDGREWFDDSLNILKQQKEAIIKGKKWADDDIIEDDDVFEDN